MSTAFRDAVDDSLINQKKKQRFGENGCLEYTDFGIGSDILAISQMVRDGNPTSLAKSILSRGDPSELVDLAVLTFVTRNTRGGKGEKKLAYDLFLEIWSQYPITAKKLLRLFPTYGYWKDMFLLIELATTTSTNVDMMPTVIDIVMEQWLKDLAAIKLHKAKLLAVQKGGDEYAKLIKKGPAISLLAKWLPRENSKLDKTTGFVKRFVEVAYPRVEKNINDSCDITAWKRWAKTQYRKQVSELTEYLALPEVLFAAQRADEINLARVASKATKNLTKAFLNEHCKTGRLRSNDAKRLKLRDLFLEQMMKRGLKGGQVMPHEIVERIFKDGSKITKGMELALDAMWNDMWKQVLKQVKAKAKEEGVEFDPTQMVPICDVSGSMSGTPMHVAIGLSIGISQITHPAFQNMILTFSAEPTWHRLKPNDTIVQKVKQLRNAPWGMNTNFCKAYDMVLKVCSDNKLSRKDMPSIIVFSDMQFDEACGFSGYAYHYQDWKSAALNGGTMDIMFDTIKKKVAHVANQLGWDDPDPTPIVFWNLRNTGGHPVNKDTEGAVLLAGYSPSMLKMVMNGDALKEEKVEVVKNDGTVVTEKVRVTPQEVLRKMLDDSLYDPVRDILGKSMERNLREYEFLTPGDGNGDDLVLSLEDEASDIVEEVTKANLNEDDFEIL